MHAIDDYMNKENCGWWITISAVFFIVFIVAWFGVKEAQLLWIL